MTTRRGRPPHPDRLTPAEWRVVDAVRHGLSNPEIARALGVSIDAVKFHVANALSKLGMTSRRDIRHWSGIARDSALAPSTERIAMNISLSGIGQIARGVSDIAAATRWYAEVLRLPHLYSFGNLAFFDCGGTRLFLAESESTETPSILYFRVDDIHAARDALAARGVEFINAPHMIHRHADGTEEWMAFFKDIDGHPLALMTAVRAQGEGGAKTSD